MRKVNCECFTNGRLGFLSNIAGKYGLDISELIEANSHLQNFQVIDPGQLLVMPSSKKLDSDSFYQLEPSEFYSLVNHNSFTRRQTAEVITWTIAVSGGEAIITLAGTAAVTGITVVVAVAAVAGLAYLTAGDKKLRMNSATNVGVPPPSSPNASVNVNSNTNVMGASVLLSEMAKAKRRIESEFAITLGCVDVNQLNCSSQ